MKKSNYIWNLVTLLLGILIGTQIKVGHDENVKMEEKGRTQTKNPYKIQKIGNSNEQSEKEYEEVINTKAVYSNANSHGVSRKNRWVQKNEKEYVQNLIDLGVPQEKISKLIGQRANLVELANADKVFRQEMQKERLMFLHEIKQSMTPEMYDIFEETELIRGSEREFVKMAESGNPVSTYLTVEDESNLQFMLVENDMLTTESWDGPLDPLPNPLVGKEAVREHMFEYMNRLENNLPILIDKMMEASFETETIESVKLYYEGEINALDRGYLSLLDENQLPIAERVERFNKLIEPQLQRQSRQKETEQRVKSSFDTIIGN
jgi:hypothetical protein